MRITSRFALLTACSALLAGCDGNGGTGTLTILATDEPFAHAYVQEASIEVTRVDAHRDAEAQSGFALLRNESMSMDLAQLNGGLTALLAEAEVSAGTYRQVRLFVGSATLRLVDPNEPQRTATYSTADGTLQLSSQAETGFKIFIDPAVEVIDGFSTELLFDFDLTRSYIAVGATDENDPLTALTYVLNPVIRVTNLSDTGEIRGQVTDAGSAAEDVTVYVYENGAELATTGLDAGAYAVMGLPEGTYDVEARHNDGRSVSQTGVQVNVGSVTEVNLSLP